MHGDRQWKKPSIFHPLEASLVVVDNFAVIGWKCKKYHEKVFIYNKRYNGDMVIMNGYDAKCVSNKQVSNSFQKFYKIL